MGRVIYTTSSGDDLHLDQLYVFLKTLYVYGSTAPIIIDLYNCDDIDDKIRSINPRVAKINHCDINNSIGGVVPDCKDIPAKNLPMMYTRPFGIMKMLEEGHGIILSIDTDILFRGSIDSQWNGQYDMKLWTRMDKRDKLKFQGGVVFYRNNQRIRDYYKELVETLTGSDRVYVCQEQMYLLALKHRLHVFSMGKRYNDSDLSTDSAVWHIKHSHYGNKRWVKNFNGILESI